MILTLRWGEIVTGEEEEHLSWKKATQKSGARAHPRECTGNRGAGTGKEAAVAQK